MCCVKRGRAIRKGSILRFISPFSINCNLKGSKKEQEGEIGEKYKKGEVWGERRKQHERKRG